MVDDLDGGKASETVLFGLDGVDYQIDLSRRNASALRKTLAEFLAAARTTPAAASARRSRPAAAPTRKPAGPRGAGKPATDRPDPTLVRQWAHHSGVQVPARGRLSDDVIAQYEAAHTEPDTQPPQSDQAGPADHTGQNSDDASQDHW